MHPPRRTWHLKETDPLLVNRLVETVSLSSLTARLLVNRGVVDADGARAFLKPEVSMLHDPLLLPDMDRGVAAILDALARDKTIAVYGDYDVDGITATALLTSFLRGVSSRVLYFLPERLHNGYGFSGETLAALRHLGADLVITVDCGVANADEVTAGRRLGLEFIVTDHHPSPTIPEMVPVINPQRQDSRYPCRDLAGVGVAFKLVQALRRSAAGNDPLSRRLRQQDETALLDMVAIGTIGDVVSLTGENRVLTRLGLDRLSSNRRPGMAALCAVAGLPQVITAGAVAHHLAPRLNASGRMGKADRGVELFLEQDRHRARALAEELDKENRARQIVEESVFRNARAAVDDQGPDLPPALVLHSRLWHPGIIGIVASRLADIYNRPAALLAGDGELLKGSIRSVPECPLPEILGQCTDHLVSWGGHRLAVGFVLRRERLEIFRTDFTAAAGRWDTDTAKNRLVIDAELPFGEVRPGLLRSIEPLEPFGSGNPPPVFISRRVELARDPEVVGAHHLRLALRDRGKTLRGMGFRLGHLAPTLWRGAPVDVVYTLQRESLRTGEGFLLGVKDIRPHGGADARD